MNFAKRTQFRFVAHGLACLSPDLRLFDLVQYWIGIGKVVRCRVSVRCNPSAVGRGKANKVISQNKTGMSARSSSPKMKMELREELSLSPVSRKVISAKQSQFFRKLKKQRHIYPR